MIDKQQCAAKVHHPNTVGPFRCRRNAAKGSDYCKQHDPVLVRARDDLKYKNYRKAREDEIKRKISAMRWQWRVMALSTKCNVCNAKKGKPCGNAIQVNSTDLYTPFIHLDRMKIDD